uniref:Apple domain-containing protein n=1 Tax=Macrostomum lignano TaxID=282301 RepID=A0A1I8GJG2_9PLAT
MLIYKAAVSLLVAGSACCLLSLLSEAAGLTVQLTIVAGCPDNLTLFSRVSGVRDPRACSVECAIRPNCSAVYKQNSVCYFAVGEQYPLLWTGGGCSSEAVRGRLTCSFPNDNCTGMPAARKHCTKNLHYLTCLGTNVYAEMPCANGTSRNANTCPPP